MAEDYLMILSPITIGFVVGFICPTGRDRAKRVKARPDPWVFGVAWSILYLLIGYSWYLMKDDKYSKVIWPLLIFLLNLWVILEGCTRFRDTRLSLYTLALCFTVSLGAMVYTMNKEEIAAFCLLPLTGWLFFAFNLAFWDFNK